MDAVSSYAFVVVVVVVVVFYVEISPHVPVPLFGQDQSTVAQRSETTVHSMMNCV